MSIFAKGTIAELARKHNISHALMNYRIFKVKDLQLTQEAIEIHTRKTNEKKKATQLLNKIESQEAI
jgi:pimeloyl-CoA synthetase